MAVRIKLTDRELKRQTLELLWEYEELEEQLSSLESEIERNGLRLGETVDAVGIRASYYKGSRSFDYEGTARKNEKVDIETIEKFTETIVTPDRDVTDWKAVCKEFLELNEDAIIHTTGEPSVKIRKSK